MVRLVRWIVAGLLALVAAAGIFVWTTAPSAGAGQLLLPAKTDFSRGRFFAYVGPWGGETLALTRLWSRFADKMVLDLEKFPADTRIAWRWPPYAPSTGPGVWGYNWVAYDNYDGGIPEQSVAPVRVRDLKAFRQRFRWSMNNDWGDANVLTEFYLRSNTTDVESKRIEIGWFLHAPKSMRDFFDNSRLVGTYVDPQGRRWTVRIADRFCMLAPEVPGDLPAGEIDMLHALGWLRERGLVKGDEWLWGVAIGAEPVTGMGELKLHDWQVVRQ